jgi:glycosyltransferase involved in cell wall biosynthesis
MPAAVFVAPGPLDARTGGYIYNRRIADGLRQHGWLVDALELDPGFPYPTHAALEQAGLALAAIRAGTITIVDSLALGAMPDIIVREASRLSLVALIHQPLAAAIGLDPYTAARFEEGERRALRAASLVVATGRAAIPMITKYGIASEQVVVVEPGTDRPSAASSVGADDLPSTVGQTLSGLPAGPDKARPTAIESRDPLELLTVATVNAGKGHEMLLQALALAGDVPWRLTCAGSLERDPATVRRVRAAVVKLRLQDRVSFAGDLNDRALAACYDGADLFVLATHQETYGMAVAEALAHGLPVIATMTGAIPELVGDDAGLVVPVGDTAALAEALARVLVDDALRARLADGARRRGEELPTWDQACRRMGAALNRLCGVTARG